MIGSSATAPPPHDTGSLPACDRPNGRRLSLSGSRLLIVEDDYVLADELRADFEDAGLHVLQPVPTVEAGHAAVAVSEPDIAILDINLRGQPVFPLADALIRQGILVAFYTGYDRSLLPEHLQHVPCIPKPAGAEAIVAALRGVRPALGRGRLVLTLLPELRLYAASITGEVATGDSLVEAALERATANIACWPSGVALDDWLRDLIGSAAIEAGYERPH